MLQNRLLVSVVAFALAAFAFYHFGLSPKRKEAADVKAKVAQAQSQLDQARALLAANQQAKASYRQSYGTVVRLGKAVPGDDDVRSLMVQLDNAAKKTHVDFQNIDVSGAGGAATTTGVVSTTPLPPGSTVGPAGFPVMPFSFTFRGGFFRLGQFFSKLDAFVRDGRQMVVNGRLLTVDSVKLEPDTTGFPNIKATVTASSYIVSPLEGATGGATPAGPAAAAGATTTVPSGSAGTPPTTTATIR